MAYGLTPAEELRFRSVFDTLDEDGDGKLSFYDMERMIEVVTGRLYSAKEIEEFLCDSGANTNSSMIGFEQFVEYLKIERSKRDEMSQSDESSEDFRDAFEEAAMRRKHARFTKVFNTFDTKHDNKITPDEMTTALNNLGHQVDEQRIKILFDTYDKNKTGALEYEEFATFLDELIYKEIARETR